jgi:hypothetical protein
LVQFRLERYTADIHSLQQMNQDSFIAMLKRYSTGFARFETPFPLGHLFDNHIMSGL